MARIRFHEGYDERPYFDSLGFLTVGWGHKIHDQEVRNYLPRHTLGEMFEHLHDRAIHEHWFEQDVLRAVRDAQRYIGKDCWETLSAARQEVLSEAAFQLGYTGLCRFVRLRKAVRDGQWVKAEAEMLDSKVAREQAPNRWRELASRMLEGG